MSKSVSARDQVETKYKWRSEDIYSDSGQWEEGVRALRTQAEAFRLYRGRVAENPMSAIRCFFDMHNLLSRLYTYAALQKDTDGGNPEYRSMYEKVSTLSVTVQSAASFLHPELITMGADALGTLAANTQNADFDRYILNIIREKPHILSESEEYVLAMSGDIFQAPSDIFSSFTQVDLSFPDVHNEQGGMMKLTEANYFTFISSTQQKVREEAFTALFSTYASFGNTLASAYAANVKKNKLLAGIRKFPSCAEAALFENEIPLSVYESLIAGVHNALPSLRDYLSLKQKALGLDALHLYDLYCPLTPSSDLVLPYEDAYRMVVEGLAPLGADYTEQLTRAYHERWLDVYPNIGKQAGAYSTAVYGCHPFILLNHLDDLESTLTIAHELGHAMHSFYAMAHQPYPKHDYAIFAAEVASTCNEVIMLRYLIEKYSDNKAVLVCLINQFLEQYRTTVFRQTMFAEFEHLTHHMVENGEPLIYESLSDAYYHLNEYYFGDACLIDPLIRNEWLRIPHFYSAFYVYQYATGFSAAVCLAERILNKEPGALEGYIRFLSAGSSIPPLEALKLAGVNMSTPEPVEKAMSAFVTLLMTMKTMLEPSA